MPQTTLDCKGMPCPQPVLKCRDCLDSMRPAELSVIVDNEAAKENVSRFLGSKGYTVHAEGKGRDFVLHAIAGPGQPTDSNDDCPDCRIASDEELAQAAQRTVVFLTSEHLGRGDDGLGGKLMANFVATLPELGPSFWRIMLVNSGVKLACEGSPAVDKLVQMEADGLSILVCGTCLEHFGLTRAKRAGETTNMLDIVSSLQLADKIIKI